MTDRASRTLIVMCAYTEDRCAKLVAAVDGLSSELAYTLHTLRRRPAQFDRYDFPSQFYQPREVDGDYVGYGYYDMGLSVWSGFTAAGQRASRSRLRIADLVN